jgi:hypothetical protein
MKSRMLGFVFAVALATGSPAVADPILPNTTLSVGPGFALAAYPPSPSFPPTPIFVAFPPNPCLASCGTQTLDLTNPVNPVINLVTVAQGPIQDFSILWGMMLPAVQDNFVYTLPAAPDAQGNTQWSATLMDATGAPIATFNGTFQVLGPAGSSITGWVADKPASKDKVQFLEVKVETATITSFAATDPTLGFTLSENGTPLSFTPVPEPCSLLFLASGLAALAGIRRRQKRAP